jgi:hypothetical protein
MIRGLFAPTTSIAMTLLTRLRLIAPLTALLVAPLLSLPAAAADNPKPKPKAEASFGGGQASGAFLTRDQLRACMNRQAKITEDDAALQKEQAEIATLKDAIARSGDQLKQQLESVDRSNAEAVAGYNEAVKTRDRQIDAYQARVDAFNARVDAGNTERAAFVQACNNRRYLEEDESAIKKGK